MFAVPLSTLSKYLASSRFLSATSPSFWFTCSWCCCNCCPLWEKVWWKSQRGLLAKYTLLMGNHFVTGLAPSDSNYLEAAQTLPNVLLHSLGIPSLTWRDARHCFTRALPPPQLNSSSRVIFAWQNQETLVSWQYKTALQGQDVTCGSLNPSDYYSLTFKLRYERSS